MAVIQRMESVFGSENVSHFAIALFLSIAYACSIGGVATPVTHVGNWLKQFRSEHHQIWYFYNSLKLLFLKQHRHRFCGGWDLQFHSQLS